MRERNVKFSEKYSKISNSKLGISLSYAYEIFVSPSQTLLLNSSNVELNINTQKFFPFSAIKLVKGEFNDSGDNVIILKGVFEPQGITKAMNLAGCVIKIYSFFDGVLSPLVTYFITEFEKNNLDFIIKCEPETAKYNQSLLLSFSKTCRANFGDNKCQVDVNVHKRLYQIASISHKIINVAEVEVVNGYYNSGKAFFALGEERVLSFKITSHYGGRIELEEEVPEALREQTQVRLAPTCDKKFRTCCNKFNNAVNFRGEPTIVEHNLLKINAE